LQLTILLSTRPFFDSVKINLPNVKKPLEIISKGAPKHPYVKSLSVNGESVQTAVITHDQIAQGGTIRFEMSSKPEAWASSTLVG
jgi:putative alpha-1,2-mannosidase